MKRSVFFMWMALVVGITLSIFVLCYAYFYPKQYVKDEKGEYINVNVPEAETFPITKDTTFLIEYYYPEEHRTLTEKVENIPVLLGCDQDGVSNYLKDYMKHLSVDEKQEGLQSYELISYTKQQITLRKTFRKEEYNGFIAKCFNGTVVILNGDGKTVYEYTEIDISTLPEELQISVEQGYPIENEEDLYSFLENYSS